MPLQFLQFDDKEFQIIMPNKAHEPAYRRRLTALIRTKFGAKVESDQTLQALLDCFNFYAEELEIAIREIKDVNFFVFVYLLHEDSAEISYLTQNTAEFPIDRSYFNLYRRILKLILQESCMINAISSPAPDKLWMDKHVSVIEKLIYLGDFLIMMVDAISEQKITDGSIEISLDSGLLTFQNSTAWKDFLPALLSGFAEDGRESLIEEGLEVHFNKKLKSEIGLDLSDIRSVMGTLNEKLHNMNPPRFVLLDELLKVLVQQASNDLVTPFIKGLILNKDNVASIRNAVEKPYLGKRIIHRPLLTLNIDGDECILVYPYSFEEAMNTFFQNNITLGKFPEDWKALPFMEELVKEFKQKHKDILEDPVEKLLKTFAVPYDRNVKVLFKQDHQHVSINLKPGEIDFIFLLGKKIFIADCKNLTKRYEMHGWFQDISKFANHGYNKKMEEKIAFLQKNSSLLESHLRIALKIPDLDIRDYSIQGIFIINTPTIYMLNGEFKIYTYHRFNQLLQGQDFFDRYIMWPRVNPSRRIMWPFIDSLKQIARQEAI
ncbi:hypothetical protein KHS38_14015 [Mucilaginibacter sp. Bleaf8]|uniref:hypothetical protein n=1 Tax=Mucilaginibacter sp. Bleaf8 TaxID=2834430 RepID=UPI001BCBF3FA|nr:hypothetical protein [Mucilaginibacter sp. Bleaf8]MBS7565524.1 hypothetical protein [Mucilaginibacter sp. Bleaf8]